ncbi:RING-H2 finger protein ATL22-like [Humulus lupulus]|uniref:RING-H2 finger protein ATL22-like n=1 Tax=Humulus lupulus TaxID=3486 RepID=UPI002B40FB84|nr:RING-H2 finger protein ATL22-like [Humulus lupulus]
MSTFTLFFFIVFFSFTTISIEAQNKPSKHCSNGGPDIQSPFHIRGQTKKNDTLIEVVCRDNSTTIHFPPYGDLVVKSISYDTQRLDLLDPKSCIHGVFLNLDLSQTTFDYYYLLKNYTYLNCTDKLSPVFKEVPCLSGSDHFVYTVEPSSMAVPSFCKAIKTIAIPFGYSPYLSGNSFGLSLTWGFLSAQDFDHKDGFRVRHVQVLSIGIFVMAMAIVGAALLIRSRIVHDLKKLAFQENLGNQTAEVEKFLGDYKAFSTGEAHIDQVSSQC